MITILTKPRMILLLKKTKEDTTKILLIDNRLSVLGERQRDRRSVKSGENPSILGTSS